MQLWVNLFNSSKIVFDSLNVRLHLVKLCKISVKRSARNLWQQIAFLWFWHMQAQCRSLKSLAARAYFFYLSEWKIVSVEREHLRLKETLFYFIFQELWKYFFDLLIHFFLMWHFSFRAAAPNLHVSPKTEIYLDFSIKNAGFVLAVENIYATSQFSCTISTVSLWS